MKAFKLVVKTDIQNNRCSKVINKYGDRITHGGVVEKIREN